MPRDLHNDVLYTSIWFRGHNSRDICFILLGEGSPTYIWMMYLWDRIPQNTYLTEPKVLVPHLIRHVLPKTKFIITLRDPIER